ncbi:MAG: hypothetical protein K2R98_25980 [Gemmataceae bacterium]|nr:hypothetical protein [Gemmataceae bacterium]
MTNEQEIILDRLMGVEKIGVQWRTGPLGVAALAIGNQWPRNGACVSRALGYPGVLCYAIHGASGVLKTIDDRRRLAISLFAAVPPRAKVKRLPRRRSAEVAIWAALRVHPLTHEGECPLAVWASRQMEQSLKNGNWPGQAMPRNVRCPVDVPARKWTKEWGDSSASRAIMALHDALIVGVRAPSGERNVAHSLKRVGFNCGRVAALTDSAEGGVEFCIALARELEL